MWWRGEFDLEFVISISHLAVAQASQYQQAAFCLEEALLHEPGRMGLHLLYADTLYTIGGSVRGIFKLWGVHSLGLLSNFNS